MTRYLLRRLPSALVVLVVASFAIFGLVRLVPGDPVSTLAGPDATPAARAEITHQLGLDRPFLSQYFTWLGNVLHFHLGKSFRLGGSVSSLIGAGARNTLVLTATALVLSVVIALLLSTVSVILDRRWLNALVSAYATLAVAVPTFVTGLVLILVFAVLWPVLPSAGTPPGGYAANLSITAQYLLLPALCLAVPVSAGLTRFLTESLRSQLRQPYVTTARALGIPRRRIVLTQALRNALPTTLTVLGLQVGALLGGAVLVEEIFTWPGLGRLIEQAISSRDYPVIQVLLLLSVAVFVAIQLVTDVLHAWLDPRIRIGGNA